MAKPMALRLALHEIKSGWRHFKVFLACLMLGVTVMATVNSMGAMINYAFNEEAQSLLGGDMEIRLRGRAANAEQREYFDSLGTVSYVSTMRSMLRVNDQTALVELKAIDERYPLIGELVLQQKDISLAQALQNNGVVIDETLLSQLDLSIGDTFSVGRAQYTIRATLDIEPDRAVQVFSFGPRVMLTHEALNASGLVTPLSLIEQRYRILLPQTPKDARAFEAQVEETLAKRFPENSWRVTMTTDGNPMVERFVSQLLGFLTVSALATFLIAGIGIASSVRAYLERKMNSIAMMKVLGGTRASIFATFALVLGFLALAGGAVGVLVSIMLIQIATPLLAQLIPTLASHGAVQATPLLLALWYGVLITFIFSLPALLNALDTRASQLFRSKSGVLPMHLSRPILGALALLLTLLLVTLLLASADKGFTAAVLAIFMLSFGLFFVCATIVRKWAKNRSAQTPWMRLALGNMHRPGNSTGTIIYAIGISLSVLIALILTEANFQSRIQTIMKEEAPSLFMIDIYPHQREAIAQMLEPYAAPGSIVQQPMIRGRIIKKNGKTITPADVKDDIRWALRGDRGLSYSATPPKNAQLSVGEWWPEDYDGDPLISVDDRFMEGMGLSLGDTLTLNILGEEITAQVANARKIDYTTFQINFSLMMSPGLLNDFPQTYLTTVHLKHAQRDEAQIVRDITQAYPGVTIIRTTQVVNVVKDLIEKIAIALRVTVLISLFAGVLVLMSALTATLQQRLYDIAVLKVLGARKGDILKSCLAEWGTLSLVTCLFASAIGTFGAWLIVMRLRSQHFDLMPHITLASVMLCFAVVALTGYIGNKRLFSLRPASLLRNE